jgi:hypothetical protein
MRWWRPKATRSFRVARVRAIGVAPLECKSCCYLLPCHYVMSLPRIRVVVAHSLGAFIGGIHGSLLLLCKGQSVKIQLHHCHRPWKGFLVNGEMKWTNFLFKFSQTTPLIKSWKISNINGLSRWWAPGLYWSCKTSSSWNEGHSDV